MSPKELRDLADLVERGLARAEARQIDVLLGNREDYLGCVDVSGEKYPVRQTHDTRIQIEVTTLGPMEFFIRDLIHPEGRWRKV